MDTLALRSPPPLGVLREDGSLDPARAAELPGELAVALYEHMALSRALDERLSAWQREGLVGRHAAATGEEAAIVGAAAGMNDEDWLFPSSSEFAAALWRGMTLTAYAHHALATSLAPARGRSAPDAPPSRSARVASVSPLAGTQISHAVGFAWAAAMRAERVAALAFFDDGATSTGDFHAGLNFAGVTRAPVVALCRSRPPDATSSRQTVSSGIAIKAVAYGLHGVRVDGADVLAVLSVVREARERAVDGRGATLVEAVVPGVDRVDPLVRMRRHLEARSLWDEGREGRLKAEIGRAHV